MFSSKKKAAYAPFTPSMTVSKAMERDFLQFVNCAHPSWFTHLVYDFRSAKYAPAHMEVMKARIDSCSEVEKGPSVAQVKRVSKESMNKMYERILEHGFSPYTSADERESDDEYGLTITPSEEPAYTYPPTVIRPLIEPERASFRRFNHQPMNGEICLPITVIEHLIRIRKLGSFRKIHDFCRAISVKKEHCKEFVWANRALMEAYFRAC